MPTTYATPTDNRMAYHLDGTQFKYRDGGNNWSIDTMSTYGALLNDESSTGSWNISYPPTTGYSAWFFPELRDFTGYYFWRTYGGMASFLYDTSVDTTDGINGTWTARGSYAVNDYVVPGGPSTPGFRAPTMLGSPITGIRGIRFSFFQAGTGGTAGCGWYVAHLYGKKSTQDGLQFWHPTADIVLPQSFLDFGDQPVSTTVSTTFRLKNNSSQQANGVVIDQTAMAGSDMALTFSFGGGSYAAPINIGDIAGGGTLSGVVTARRIVPSNETVGSRTVRISAVATSWT